MQAGCDTKIESMFKDRISENLFTKPERLT